MQKILFYFLSLFLSSFLFAQNISGTVQDANTKEPISYATIQVKKNHGTITNDEGKFSLNLKNIKKSDSIKISFIGYKTASFLIKDLPETVLLQQDVINLDAVNLDEKILSVEEIIQKASENYGENYNNFKQTKHRVFIRNKSTTKMKEFKMDIDKAKNYDKKMIAKLNKLIDSIRQPMISNASVEYSDLLFDLYLKNKDSLKTEFVKATKLSNPNSDYSTEGIQKKLKNGFRNLFKDKVFKIKILFFKVEDSLKTDELSKEEKSILIPSVISRQMNGVLKNTSFNENELISEILNPKYYDYKITNNLFYNNEFVYEITYTPKKSKAKYQGKIYISDETFAVIKLNFNMLPNKKLEGTSLKWLGMAYKIYDWKGSLEFYQNDSGKYVPKYIRQSKKMYSYAKMPLKFIENTKNKNKLKFKMKTKFETEVQYQSEILFLTNASISKSAFKNIKQKKEFPLEKISQYNPETWKEYNIIAPTQSLKDFKVEQ